MGTFRKGIMFTIFLLSLCIIAAGLTVSREVRSTVMPELHTTEFQKAFFEASKVYGRAGCGDQALAEMTARKAVATGIPAQLIAAMAASESTCNPMAISNRGAVGLMQVVPRTWGKEFDFTKINLLNPEQNMEVSTKITARLIRQYGVRNGLLHYYGTGSDGIGLGGAGYADHVLKMAGKL